MPGVACNRKKRVTSTPCCISTLAPSLHNTSGRAQSGAFHVGRGLTTRAADRQKKETPEPAHHQPQHRPRYQDEQRSRAFSSAAARLTPDQKNGPRPWHFYFCWGLLVDCGQISPGLPLSALGSESKDRGSSPREASRVAPRCGRGRGKERSVASPRAGSTSASPC